MISGINSSLSALQAFGTKVAAHADNVANIDTDGFKKTRVDLEEGAPQGVKVMVRRIDTPGPRAQEQSASGEAIMVEKSNVEPAEELPDLMLTKRYYQANLKTIAIQDEMLGSLLDIKS